MRGAPYLARARFKVRLNFPFSSADGSTTPDPTQARPRSSVNFHLNSDHPFDQLRVGDGVARAATGYQQHVGLRTVIESVVGDDFLAIDGVHRIKSLCDGEDLVTGALRRVSRVRRSR